MVRHPFKRMPSPVGKLTLVAREGKLAAILWEKDRPGRVRLELGEENSREPILLEAERQLEAYFSGSRTRFDLELDPAGTEFQKRVWNALIDIPHGETRTYLQIANQLGNPKATRAVGAANGRNPISIIVPCHRLIGSSGGLTGFAGGLDAKAYLLELESGLAKR